MEKNIPLVSIIVASYNGEKYIEDQILSLVHQTYQNIEIIVTDDCSKDTTAEIVKSLSKEYNNIKFFQNETNLGYQKNFERGILLAKGEYIAISDQDDLWSPKKIATLLEQMGSNILVYSNSLLINSDGKNLGITMKEFLKIKEFISGKNPYYFIVDNCVSGHAMMFRSSLVSSIVPIPDCIIYDRWIALAASINAGIKFVDEPLVQHRLHQTNAISNRTKHSHHLKDNVNRLNGDSEVRHMRKLNRKKEQLKALDRLTCSSIKTESSISKDIAYYCKRITKLDKSFLDFKFFYFLFKRRHLFYPSKSLYKGVKNCFKGAKGKYWYTVFSLLGINSIMRKNEHAGH